MGHLSYRDIPVFIHVVHYGGEHDIDLRMHPNTETPRC